MYIITMHLIYLPQLEVKRKYDKNFKYIFTTVTVDTVDS